MSKVIEIGCVILILTAFYFILDILKLVVQFWYVFVILGVAAFLYEMFSDSPAASTSNQTPEGTYTVYSHGENNNRVDRYYIDKES